uniref:Uncharacterized protein n=1 Tax=Rhizophora mucronata TaxID=61149 RepID=A0A2P2R0Y0_RHIMU
MSIFNHSSGFQAIKRGHFK